MDEEEVDVELDVAAELLAVDSAAESSVYSLVVSDDVVDMSPLPSCLPVTRPGQAVMLTPRPS